MEGHRAIRLLQTNASAVLRSIMPVTMVDFNMLRRAAGSLRFIDS
jgi:hypothetical protein